MKILLILILSFANLAWAQDYPAEWFKEIPRSEAESWEILPQDAKEGEVILSKRTELGIFSNLLKQDSHSITNLSLRWRAFGSL